MFRGRLQNIDPEDHRLDFAESLILSRNHQQYALVAAPTIARPFVVAKAKWGYGRESLPDLPIIAGDLLDTLERNEATWGPHSGSSEARNFVSRVASWLWGIRQGLSTSTAAADIELQSFA
ncbi:MAG: hypothetical protein M1838_006036 [Thelocarpon superellum]|nr:MAG: hypothetical protein M1838_006036 [Thelocarpon superellum]